MIGLEKKRKKGKKKFARLLPDCPFRDMSLRLGTVTVNCFPPENTTWATSVREHLVQPRPDGRQRIE